MTDFRARIGRVRMKSGGADVRVLHTPQPNDGGTENWRGKLIEHAKEVAGYEGVLDGYVVIGLWEDGCRSLAYRFSPRIPRDLMPSYVAEMLRRDAITEHEAKETFNSMFEWRDG
jgi:hypothetical protein